MESSRNFIGLSSELTSGMKGRHYRFKSRNFSLRMDVNGNTATIVGNTYFITGQKLNPDVFGKTRHRLVNGVIKNLPNKVVQTINASGANVHSGTLSDRLQAL